MDDHLNDKAADGLLALMPLYHRHIFRINRHASGLKTAQYRVLGVLMKSGPCPISEIGRVLYISKPYMTVLIDSLMEKGWIDRGHNPDDRRVILVSITSEGKKHLHRAFEVYKEDVKTLLSRLERNDIGQLCSSAERLREILEKLV